MPILSSNVTPKHGLGRQPTSADDIVVMVLDVLYDDRASNGATQPQEVIVQLMEILDSPLAVEIYENEMARRQPRDADRWH